MNYKLKLKSLVLIVLVSIFASCSKKDSTTTTSSSSSTTGTSASRCYPTNLLIVGFIDVKFIYNSNNQEIEEDDYDSTGKIIQNVYKYEYNSNGMESKANEFANGNLAGHYTYDYNGTNISVLHHFDNSSTEITRTFYTWSNNMIIADTTFSISFSKLLPSAYNSYNYDTKGNVLTYKSYNYNSSTSTYILFNSIEYQYDTKNNPWKGLASDGFDVTRMCPNNAIITTYKDANGNITSTDNFIISSYNANGYPTKANVNSLGVGSVSIDYNCK